ncbi:MAG: hypothetical protein ACXWKQ_07335 [Reyranella sp.]
MRKSWAQLDEERQALPDKLSRAELARRAGISESTITKGIKSGAHPRRPQRELVEVVLDMERRVGGAA